MINNHQRVDIHREVNQLLLNEIEYVAESGWLEHLPFAYVLACFTVPEVLVELATYRGASYFSFCQAVQDHGFASKCFAVDTWKGDKHCGVYGEDVYTAVAKHNAKYAFSTLIREQFSVAVKRFDDETIDLLHVDGLHTYDAVRRDIDMWLPKMSKAGIIVLHDTMVRKRDFGVWRLWAEIKEEYPSFEFTNGHGLGIAVVGNRPAPEVLRLIDELRTDPALRNILRIAGAYYEGKQSNLEKITKKRTSIRRLYRRVKRRLKSSHVYHFRHRENAGTGVDL